jgi:hypothetical protein
MQCISLGIILGLQLMPAAVRIAAVRLFDDSGPSQPMITL